MYDFMKTIISAIRYWIRENFKVATDDDIMDVLTEMNYIEPISASDGSIYTNNDGEIYIL